MIEKNLENRIWLANTVLQTSQDQYKQLWSASVNESSKCVNYRIFKTEHKFENYLLNLPFKLRKSFINYRLCNNKLPTENGRWLNIDRNLRKCTLCNTNAVGDEFHYVFECCAFDFDKEIYLTFVNKRNVNCILFTNNVLSNSSLWLLYSSQWSKEYSVVSMSPRTLCGDTFWPIVCLFIQDGVSSLQLNDLLECHFVWEVKSAVDD